MTRRHFFATGAAAAAAPVAAVPAAEAPRDLFRRGVPAARLAQVLLARERWRPYPVAGEWSTLPAATRQLLVEDGEAALKTPWAVLPATLFLEFKRIGNRSHYERVYMERRAKLRSLVLAECAEGKGRFLDEVVNGLWLTCEETWWGLPAHLSLQKAGPGLPDAAEPVIDLFAAETSMLLSWALYLLASEFDKVSPLLRGRLHSEIDRRILAPGYARTDFWWMGFDRSRKLNNWTPWICANWLTSSLLTDLDESRRRASVAKILQVLDFFLNGYDDDGGCDEGPGYWNAAGGALFDNLDLLHSASSGAIDFYRVPLVQEIGRYIYRAHIAGEYYTNFADASAVVSIDGNMVWRYGTRIGDAKMASLGAWAAARGRPLGGGSIGRQLPHIFSLEEMRRAPAAETLVRDAWLPGTQVMAARSREGSTAGLYLAAQGGHNAESHNHNDVGNFLLYANGKPVIIDVGVETYSAKTFSSKRYEIWTMQSAYHNLPTIGGVMQKEGQQYAARDVHYRADDASAEFSLDLARAYPAEAGVKTWQRRLRLDRARNQVTVSDRYTAAQAPRELTLTLMTPLRMTQSGPGTLTLDTVRVQYDDALFTASQEEIKIEDARLRGAWGERLYRILLTARRPTAQGAWDVRFTLVL
jgi:hypothetical protein